MPSAEQSERETYRAILFGQDGNELLLRPAGDGFLLPSVDIPRWQRIAENINVAIRREWNQEAICLYSPDLSASVTYADDHKYQVMECFGPAKPHTCAKWVEVSSLTERTFIDPADQVAVERSLGECQPCVDVRARGPFARLGWFRELQAWIEEVIHPLGFHLTGSFSQLNASPSFSLVRFQTSDRAIWFKAVGQLNLHEFPITIALARLLPQYLPPILATRPEWNAWLAVEIEGTNLEDTQNTHYWKAAASALAKMQIESMDKALKFIQVGARDLGARALSQLVRPFFDATEKLMEKQINIPPLVLSRNELKWLGGRIEEAIALSTQLGIPDALGHLDLNAGNVIVTEDQCIFLDWAEAYVGNPLFSLQYLVAPLRRIAGMEASTVARLTSAYAEEWQSLVPTESLEPALTLAPLISVFAYAAANDMWSDQVRLQDPKIAGYLRSLTRRMHREADRLRYRSTLCPQ